MVLKKREVKKLLNRKTLVLIWDMLKVYKTAYDRGIINNFDFLKRLKSLKDIIEIMG
jgi:hypothetical protein